MSPQSRPPPDFDWPDPERDRHDRLSTLTQMRLQTQLLLRVARQLDGPARDRLVTGLSGIDAGISRLVRQLDPHLDQHEER